MKKTCPVCKDIFIDKKHPEKVCCSNACRAKNSQRYLTKPCEFCGKDVTRNRHQFKKRTFCSVVCKSSDMRGRAAPNKGKHITNRTSFKPREEHPNWRGGRIKCFDKNGYYFRKIAKDHPNRDSSGYVLEHRLVMEKKLGRYLRKEEVVHHINGIKDDNSLENLMLFSNDFEHRRFHIENPIH